MFHLIQPLLLTAVLISFLAPVVHTKPSGAPGCEANIPAITAAMGAPTGPLGYQINIASTYTAGVPMTIKITNPNPAIRTIKGILLYVMPEIDPRFRVGSFTIPAGLKSNIDKCADRAELNSVITHSDSSDKPLVNVDMVWTPGTNLSGNMIVRCMVVGTGPSNWQILDQKVISSAAGGTGASSPPASTGTPPVRKCRRFKLPPPVLQQGNIPSGTPATGLGGAIATPTSPIASTGTDVPSGVQPAGGDPNATPIPGGSLPPLGAEANTPANGQNSALPTPGTDPNAIIAASAAAVGNTYSPILLLAMTLVILSL